MASARLAVDIGGTFTDLAIENAGQRTTLKVLTTPSAPEQGVMTGVRAILAAAGLQPSDIAILVHGTTLATNAVIERKGARTALVTTEGFRDVLAMGNESRYDQYDLNIVLPEPLVPRHLRLTVPERLDNEGRILRPLDEDAVRALVPILIREEVESIAIGLLHSFVNSIHERRVYDILRHALPDVPMSLSSEVSPEMREWERFSTTAANAYVQPMMARYLRRLEADLVGMGMTAPIFLMLSGGGLTTIDTACRFPIRLVESGPAGGAIFSAHIARQCGIESVLSFDMGGTTAKVCLIDDYKPQTSRTFEVARVGLDASMAALAVVEMVDENMSNAARVHAIESGKTYDGRTLIAFGGGGPVHACRVAEKIDISRVLVPSGAGVGSAIGFLRAPVGYEVVRSLYQRFSSFDVGAVNGLLAEMETEAMGVVEQGSFGAPTAQTRIAYMRYVGQGHEIPVPLPVRPLVESDVAEIRAAYDREYIRFYDRPVPGSDVEIMSYAVVVSTMADAAEDLPVAGADSLFAPEAVSSRTQDVRDSVTGEISPWAIYDRTTLQPGARLSGPAIIAEDETSTLVGIGWSAAINSLGYIELVRETV